jgi:MYXO-CTERM domain-containing protein
VRGATASIIVAMTFVTASAIAADEDVETLLKQLNDEHAALSTQDCVIACKAAASIRRAADKICGLEPGPRCADARAKADDAQRRVQAACPDCQLAAVSPKDEERRAVKKGDAEPVPPPNGAPGSVKNVPERGGCASCSTPGERPSSDFGIAVVGAFVIARILRRRR